MFFDIETTNLNANYGYMLSFGWKCQGDKKAQVISIADYDRFEKDPTNDRDLVKDVRKIMEQADIWCGHYSQRFDVPYIQSRLLYHNLNPLPTSTPHIDTWRIARYKLKLNSNRLDTISKFIKTIDSKTPVDGTHWIRAMAGIKSSLKYVINHNRKDVEVLEEVYNRIRPLMPTHPNMNIVDAKEASCPICSNQRLQKRGWTIARVSKTRRYFCNSCGAWSKGRPERIREIEVR